MTPPPDPPPTHRHAWLLALPVVLAGALAVFPLHNDDAGFHIATGRWILRTGTVPATNPFSYAQDGATWIQHQWLPAVGIAWIVDHFGVVALVLAKAVLVLLAFALAAWSVASSHLAVAPALLLLTSGVAASAFRFYERPYLFSILALTGTAAALLRWQATGSQAARWTAALLPAVAMQLHAGGLDSVLLWIAFLVGQLAAARLGAPALPPRQVAGTFGAMAGLLVAGLAALAPSGLQVLTLPFSFSSNAYWHEHLAEFRPLAFDLSSGPQWLAVAAAAACLVQATRTRRVFEALALLGFLALALRHVRMVWPLVAVLLPVGAAVLARAGWLQRRGVRPAAVILTVLVAGWALWDQHDRFGLGLGEGGVHPIRHPLDLLDQAKALPEETLVSDGLAGTWLWRAFEPPSPGDPDGKHRVLVHNCLECYRESTYRDLYQGLRYGQPDWQRTCKRLNIRSFVLKHTTPGERRFQGGRPNLRQHLFASPDHVLVTFDDVASLYVERRSVPPNLPTLDGFPVDPDTGRPRPGTTPAQVRQALQDHAGREPKSVRGLDMLVRLEVRAGDLAAARRALAELERRQPRAPVVPFLRQLTGLQ